MAVHWTITFCPLRTNDTYTVNIYDSGYSGTPVPLKGGAQPFSTQEDDDDDMFRPVRKQSGYLRIFDDGKDADGHAFNWKSMLPTTDTDRPVTLTNAAGTVLWQGFMQAQNFGGVLYGNPQEREYPVQCALTVTECNDIDVTNHEMRNFAWLLNNIISSIPHISITRIVVQGGSDARQWLLKMIDWQNLVQVDADDVVVARYNHYQCLEDMCRFWGWTARTFGQTLYLMRPDDTDEQTFLTLTLTELATLAGGDIAAGTTSGTWSTADIGNAFASVANNDYQLRGPNKATVTSDGNAASDAIAGFADEVTSKAMEDLGWGQLQKRMVFIDGKGVGPSAWGEDGGWFQYTNDMMSFGRPYLTGECQTGMAAFCKMSSFDDGQARQYGDTYDVIVIKQPYASGASPYATLKSVYHHAFSDGIFQLKGTIYRRGNKFEVTQKNLENIGRFTMRMRLGIGKTRATATWWNGTQWTTTESDFAVSVGNKDDILRTTTTSGSTTTWRDTIQVGDGLSGQLFVEFLGSEDLPDINNERDFDIEGFSLEFTRTSQRRTSSGTTSTTTGNFGGRANYADIERSDRREYKSKNTSNVRMEWNADCIYASDNDMSFGFGVLSNPDGTYVTTITYGSKAMFAEQHQADRVTAYWATAKREIEVELLSHIIADISPMHKVTLDGTSLYPFAIGRNWRDDVTRLTLIEL